MGAKLRRCGCVAAVCVAGAVLFGPLWFTRSGRVMDTTYREQLYRTLKSPSPDARKSALRRLMKRGPEKWRPDYAAALHALRHDDSAEVRASAAVVLACALFGEEDARTVSESMSAIGQALAHDSSLDVRLAAAFAANNVLLHRRRTHGPGTTYMAAAEAVWPYAVIAAQDPDRRVRDEAQILLHIIAEDLGRSVPDCEDATGK